MTSILRCISIIDMIDIQPVTILVENKNKSTVGLKWRLFQQSSQSNVSNGNIAL